MPNYLSDMRWRAQPESAPAAHGYFGQSQPIDQAESASDRSVAARKASATTVANKVLAGWLSSAHAERLDGV